MSVAIGLESDSVGSLFAARVVGEKYTSDNKKMVVDSAKKADKYQTDSKVPFL